MVVLADELQGVINPPNVVVLLGQVVAQLKLVVFFGEFVLDTIEFVVLQFVLLFNRHIQHFLESLALRMKLDVAVNAVEYFS